MPRLLKYKLGSRLKMTCTVGIKEYNGGQLVCTSCPHLITSDNNILISSSEVEPVGSCIVNANAQL